MNTPVGIVAAAEARNVAPGKSSLWASIRVEPLGIEVSSDGEGTFRVDVPPGGYDVVLRAKGYTEQRRKIVVDRDGVVLLNVDLRGSH